jgi:hypothetical protein
VRAVFTFAESREFRSASCADVLRFRFLIHLPPSHTAFNRAEFAFLYALGLDERFAAISATIATEIIPLTI